MKMKNILTALILCCTASLFGQRNANAYWQQHVDYTMDVEMDVETFKYVGTQQLIYNFRDFQSLCPSADPTTPMKECRSKTCNLVPRSTDT